MLNSESEDESLQVGVDPAAPGTERTVIEIVTPPPGSDPAEPYIDIRVSIPARTAVELKHRTGGALDVAETLSLLAQLYSSAPLDRKPTIFTSAQHGRICEALGQSPQSTEELVSAIENCVSFGFAGARMRWNAEELEILKARNVAELPLREFAEQVFAQMKEAWLNGRI